MSMLEVKDLVVSYGAIKALRGISFQMELEKQQHYIQ